MPADFVLIAPPERLSELTTLLRLEGTVEAYSDADAVAALDATFQTLPRMVVLERAFAESLRGRAFVRRVTDDPFGRECLVRVIDAGRPHAAAPPLSVDVPTAAASEVQPPAEPASGAAARATARRQVAAGSTATIDGTTVQLVDISTEGMQVVGPLTLKPHQAVRVTVPAPDVPVKLHARVAWASLELSSQQAGLRYRAGLAFVDADLARLASVVDWLTSAGSSEG
ncbi:MAG: PilZ domain-containing protein [Vicinamibacterales bacterium]|nr:PilZ domain-containing protein [Vicinamibacterales bacterium]